MQNKLIWIIVSLLVLSGIMLLVGILILSLARKEQCSSGCYESSCLGSDYRYYSCDCGSYCQVKLIVLDGTYKFGISALVIGIVGSIFGSVLLCIYKRRQYHDQPQQTIVISTSQAPLVC